MIKEFFSEHTHLQLLLQHLGIYGGGWSIEIYNTTYDRVDPIFKHYITDEEMNSLNVSFEVAIMTPVFNWWNKKYLKGEITCKKL